MISLLDRKRETQTQQFIKIYQGLKQQGALDEGKIFETSVELLQQQRQQIKVESLEVVQESADVQEDSKLTLTEAFSQAKEASSKQSKNHDSKSEKTSQSKIGGIDIKNLFKD